MNTKDMLFLTVPKLERWQHYKDRRPPWMKLHVEIFDDYQFSMLPDSAKFHLLGIWLLATQIDNKIPFDTKWIARKIGADTDPDINLLLELGHIEYHSDSTPLAEGKQDALAETETETETETEKEKKNIKKKKGKPVPPKQVRPDDVSEEVWIDFLAVRKSKRAPVTEIVIAGLKREADKAGWSLEQSLRECVERGWQSFKAEWVDKPGGGNEKNRRVGKPSVSERATENRKAAERIWAEQETNGEFVGEDDAHLRTPIHGDFRRDGG